MTHLVPLVVVGVHKVRPVPGERGDVQQQQGELVLQRLRVLLGLDVEHAQVVGVERGYQHLLVAAHLEQQGG